ncbi:MAG: diacylglycerol/lipid kinase family protein [Faecousia sp.]
MKHLFLINPAAGKGRAGDMNRMAAEACCEFQGVDYEILVSAKPGDITRWAGEFAATGEDLRIYACGGDGTLNEAVNGVVGHPNVALTHVACGSGNDFIKLFSDPKVFGNIFNHMQQTEETELDLISCNGEYSLNICSLGFDARIGTEVAKYKRLPLVKGPTAYMLSALVNTIKGVHRPYRVEINGEVIEGDQTMICVCNGAWYGGGFHPIPEADPTDGMLDVLLVKGGSRATVLKVIGPYKEGRFREYPHLIRYYRTDRLKITCQEEEPVNLDGELRLAKEVELSVAPRKLRFFYPKAARPLWKTPAIIR